MLLRSPLPTRYFNYAGLSPTRAEAVEEIQAVSDEFRTYYSPSLASPGTANKWKMADRRLLGYFTLILAKEAILSFSYPMPQPPIDSPCLRLSSIEEIWSSCQTRSIRQHCRVYTAHV